MSSSIQGRCIMPYTQVLLGDNGGVWGQTVDEAPPADVMGEAENGGPFREVLRKPFDGHYRGDEGRPSHVHHIKYCVERVHTPLGYSGDGSGRSIGGIFQCSPDPICFVIHE